MIKPSTNRYTATRENGFELLKKGIDENAKIIVSTMGPHGSNVAVGSESMPLLTGDGVTVARHLKPEDAWARIGSDMLIDAALKTEESSGDATTSTCAIVQGLLGSLPAKFNKREMCDALVRLGEKIDQMIIDSSIPVIDGEVDMVLLKKVATISANNDEELGTMIAELVAKIGVGGVIQVHESEGEDTYTEIKKGYNYKAGILSPHFLPDGSKPMTIEHPLILLIEQKITDQNLLVPIIKAWQKEYPTNSRWLVIIASDISGSAIDMLVQNRKAGMPILAIKAPEIGQQRVEVMHDLQLITGTKNIFSEYTGNPITKFGKDSTKHFNKSQAGGEEEFGECLRLHVELKETVLFFEETDEMTKKIEEYCDGMDEVELESDERKQFYKERKSKLRNGIGHIHVGAASKTELYNKGLRVDDSQRACFSALEEGVSLGGGYALNLISRSIDNQVMKGALSHCFNVLLVNSDLKLTFWEKIIRKKLTDKYFREGKIFNVKTMQWEDIEDTMIYDATKSVRDAVRHAVSVSVEVINTDHLIQWIKN